MARTDLVLVVGLIVGGLLRLLMAVLALAACSHQAKRNGQRLKSMSWSNFHGLTAEFFPPTERQRKNPRKGA
jgi:hypothetical protein